MSENSKIEWTDATWNPLRGCSKVSEGCRNCYAIKTAHRFHKEGEAFAGLTEKTAAGLNWTGKVMLVPEKLDEPLHWREPRKIFVNSMSDLFHKDIPNEFITKVFDVMAHCYHHTFQVLTKRPERMLEFVSNYNPEDLAPYPLPNVWLGVSVENQQAADERIPLLLQTPAAVRFLSCEPLLDEVDLFKSGAIEGGCSRDGEFFAYGKIDWVIAGGESGPGARPMHPDWARSLRDQCQAAGVALHFKQWGEWLPVHPDRKSYEYASPPEKCAEIDGTRFYRIGKHKAGRLLDGRTWDEFPAINKK